MTKTKVYKHGGSQVVRVPAEVRLPSESVEVLRTPTGFQIIDPKLRDEHLKRFDAAVVQLEKANRARRKKHVR
jgi:virulence-associated protein VagC